MVSAKVAGVKTHPVRPLRRVVLAAVAAAMVLIAIAAGSAYWFFSRDGFRRALEAQATSWLGVPVRIGAARAQFFPRVAVQLRDIRVGDPAMLVLDTVALAADLRSLFGGRIENADVLVSDSRIDMPLPFALPRGTGTGTGAIPAAAVRIVSVRSIALRDVRLRSRGREIVVSADSSLADTTLTLRRFAAEAGGTTLAAEGVIGLSPRIDARLNATANRLDVDELVALVAAFTPESTGGRGTQGRRPRIVAGISAEEATAGAVAMRQFTTELTLDGDAMALNRLQFEAFRGRYDGAVTARLGTPLSARLESRVTDLDVAQLTAFAGAPGTVTGRLSGAGTFTGSGADVAALLRAARGNGTATIVDGSIQQLHLVRTVVLFFGRPAPGAGESTDRFDRLDVRFSLENRMLRAQAFSLRSPDADIAGTGSLHLDTKALDGRADIMLSEALSSQAGTDLYRYTREGNRVLLPALVGGTLAMPRLTIDAAAAAKRGLRNEIERRMKGLLEGFVR